MKSLLLVALSLTTAIISGCSLPGIRGNGNIVSEKRAIGEFTTLNAEGAFDLEWTSGSPALEITSDQNLLPRIKAELSGNTLRIYSDGELRPTKGIKLILSSKALKNIDLAGAVSLTARQLSGPSLTIGSSGAVSINASGKVDGLTAKLTGASRLTAAGLSAGDATLTLTGASHADVTASGHLKVSIVGAGSLSYAGKPASIEKSIAGAGSIHERK